MNQPKGPGAAMERRRGWGDDVESGGGFGMLAAKSSISVKGSSAVGSMSPGTASKEDRRAKGIYSIQQTTSSTSDGAGVLDAPFPSMQESPWVPGIVVVPFMVFVWYFFAVMAITTSKQIMLDVQLPNMLCTAQFFFALVATKLTSDLMSPNSESLLSASSLHKSVPHHLLPNFNSLLTQIAISYTLGFVFTNMAFSVVTASFAETVKSAEPISSVILGYIILNEVATAPTYATLVPIVVGVSISCVHDDSFDLKGFLYAAISNICFSSRAVLAKKLLKQYPGAIDEVGMFHRISLVGLVVLVPLTILTEGREIYALCTGDSTMVSTYIELLSLLFINGCAYACYNLMSFLVLSRTNLVTHAVLNCFRRVFIIVFTSLYFHVEISQFNMMGVAMAVLGVCLFAYFRSREASGRPKHEE
jgi:solute carrier family 35, member E1